ncbi:MAG: hypothetical protein WD066_15490 [Planctomycetaceae bacterium]
MSARRFPLLKFLSLQAFVLAAFAGAWLCLSDGSSQALATAVTGRSQAIVVPVARELPLVVEPLYDDPELVGDEELALVLKRLRPIFPRREMKPNHIEHALRIWGVDATFADPAALSGAELRDFLCDHATFLMAYRDEPVEPLLMERPRGIAVRWDRKPGGSVHHDHWLASLTEAGVRIDQPVFGPSRRDSDIGDVLQEALRDFRVDEAEVEWSAMAFGLWLPPVRDWRDRDGRTVSFDLIAQRLMRGHKRFGVCVGTHRVYSLMLLVRLDDAHGILTPAIRADALAHLAKVRDLLIESQYDEGYWHGNWSQGAAAKNAATDDEDYRRVIATGHHLEWLAIAPPELHPPRESLRRAARWLIDETLSVPEETLRERYTFYSHVGNALALWRGTHPATFWREWTATHGEP